MCYHHYQACLWAFSITFLRWWILAMLVCRVLNTNAVFSTHSPGWSSESVPVLCVELHESEVGVPALSLRSPISQRVRGHQHPQWLLMTHVWPHSLAVLVSQHEHVSLCQREAAVVFVVRGIGGEVETLASARDPRLPGLCLSNSPSVLYRVCVQGLFTTWQATLLTNPAAFYANLDRFHSFIHVIRQFCFSSVLFSHVSAHFYAQ